jgi:recombination protein RecR
VRSDEYLAIVEKSSDIEILVQKTNFMGRFFVLGGQIPVIEKKKRINVRLDEAMSRIQTLQQGETKLREVIICTSYNPDGVFTASVLKDRIREQFGTSFAVTTFGRGFSSGTELEYADQETLRYALEHRTQL